MLLSVVRIDLTDVIHSGALLELLDHYARDPMGGGQPLPAETLGALVDSLRARTDYLGFLALADGHAVGLVNCFEGFSTFRARPLLNVHDLVVQRAFRGRGVGQRLLTAVEHEARARGCCKLTLEVLSNNQLARHSYQRFGFAAYQLDPQAGHALFLEKKLD